MIGCITREGLDASGAAAVKAAGVPGGTMHIDQQGALSPAALAVLRQTGDGAPLSSPYGDHAAAAVVVQGFDAAGASGAGNLAQMGARRPSGDPVQVAVQPSHSAADIRAALVPAEAMRGWVR